MTGPVVARAVVEDARDVAVCQSTCWEQAYRGIVDDAYLDRVGVSERLARWRQRLGGGREVWIARHGDDVVGVASAGPSRDDPPVRTTELMSLYTLAGTHGTGLGARLLRAAIGSQPASLWVFADNPRAIAFYVKHGFVPDGTSAWDVDTGVAEVRLVR